MPDIYKYYPDYYPGMKVGDAMPITINATQFAKKWKDNLDAAGDTIKAGVAAVTVAPGEKAAAAAGKWATNLAKSETKTKWAQHVAAVTLAEWQAAMTGKGVDNISTGTEAAKPKMQAFATKLLDYQKQHLPEVLGMASLSGPNMKARMDKWFDLMSAFSWSKFD